MTAHALAGALHVPVADKLHHTHIETLRKAGQINGQEIQRIARKDVP